MTGSESNPPCSLLASTECCKMNNTDLDATELVPDRHRQMAGNESNSPCSLIVQAIVR